MTSEISFIRNFRANHLGSNLRPGAEAQFIHHAVQVRRQGFVLQLQYLCPQLRPLHPFLQGVDIGSLTIDSTKELVLLFVDIGVPRPVAICHGLSVRFDLGKVLLHLILLSLQPIPLRSNHGSVQLNWNEEGRLTLVLSPASKPQSLPTNTAEYLMDRVDPSQGLSTTSASITPQRSSVHIIASLGPCSEPRSDSRTRSITKA